jgi:cytochrome c oxidase cbb3-type subunit 3
MRTKLYLSISLVMLGTLKAFAAETAVKANASIYSNPLFIAMASLCAVLLMVIFILSAVLKTAVKTKIRELLSNKATPIILLMTMLSSNSMYAQTNLATSNIYESSPISGMHPLGFLALFLMLILELFVILWLCLMIMRIIVKQEQLAANKAGEQVEKVSWFSTFLSRKVFGVAPLETDKDVLLDHDYDGIKELDNNLPPWWKYGFYLTIISSIVYMVSYHVTHSAKSSEEEYNAEIAQAEASVNAYRAKMAMNVDETNAQYLADAGKIATGKAIFIKNCAVCHGPEGQGLVGPNFTDKHWLYGNKPGDLFKIVKNGTNKGMKAWKDELSPVDIQNVISFIHTLQGTQPANPKAAEGELYEEEVSSADLGNDSSKITGMKNIEVK